MLKNILKKGLFFVITVLMLSIISSCKKEAPTIGIIIVQNGAGNNISGALVEVYPDSIGTVDIGQTPIVEMYKKGTTDGAGSKEFEFPYEARLKVRVTKTEGNTQLKGTNFINLRKNKKEQKLIKIY